MVGSTYSFWGSDAGVTGAPACQRRGTCSFVVDSFERWRWRGPRSALRSSRRRQSPARRTMAAMVCTGRPARPTVGSARRSRRRATTGTRGPGSSRSPSRACRRRIRRTASARCSSTTAARAAPRSTPRRRSAGPVRRGQRPLRPRRLRSARRRPELAVDRLQGQPGDRRHLLEAVHDAREPRRRCAAREGQGVHPALRLAQQGHPALRLDRQRRARHGRHPGGDGRQEAELLRLLVRHLPRRDLREPVPGQLPVDGARRPGRRQRVHQQSERGPARAVGRVRGGARPVLPGLRRVPVVLPVRRQPTRGRRSTSS